MFFLICHNKLHFQLSVPQDDILEYFKNKDVGITDDIPGMLDSVKYNIWFLVHEGARRS